MRSELLIPLGGFIALAVLFVLALGHRRKQVLAFLEGMLARGIRVTVDSFTEVPTAHFNDGGVHATLRPDSTGGQHPTPLWRIEVVGVALGGMTTLTLKRGGTLTALARAAGFGGVRSGDASFDALVQVDGSDRDTVSAILAESALRHAMASFFAQQPEVFSCELSRNRTLTVRIHRTGMDIPQGLAQVKRVRDLAVALGVPSRHLG
jgi:hypothetical protein